MKEAQIEVVGKVFVVVGGERKCLICDAVFTPREASEHATIPCYPLAINATTERISYLNRGSSLN